ncbi:hypothetical protein AAFF_G00195730 [Aldrovandia affinis]|uniref:Uncharacterized protein n=1 Tax=Aldrovandia affinis TaxID=143900 RepID=A0AAD7RIM4_9TELE|nr:hypothetical protein AAFF_G00195730 [Aldrovandia affinis]
MGRTGRWQRPLLKVGAACPGRQAAGTGLWGLGVSGQNTRHLGLMGHVSSAGPGACAVPGPRAVRSTNQRISRSHKDKCPVPALPYVLCQPGSVGMFVGLVCGADLRDALISSPHLPASSTAHLHGLRPTDAQPCPHLLGSGSEEA